MLQGHIHWDLHKPCVTSLKRQEDVWYKKMNFPKKTETNVGTKNKEVIFNINNKKYSQRTYNRNNRHSWIKFKPELETGDQSTYWSHTHMAAISVQAKCCPCPIGSSSPWLRLMRGIRIHHSLWWRIGTRVEPGETGGGQHPQHYGCNTFYLQ